MITCTQCQHQNLGAARFCEACGAQLEDPRNAERQADEIEAAFLFDQVKKARGGLLAVAILGSIGGAIEVIGASAEDRMLFLVLNAIIWGLFFGLWWWSAKRPLAAALIGLTLFGSMQVLASIDDPSQIYRGIIVKVIIFAVLIRAISAGFKHRAFVRERGLD